jgi:hypothetical protein
MGKVTFMNAPLYILLGIIRTKQRWRHKNDFTAHDG